METPIKLKSVVLFIAVGAMVFIIVFIFAKRQITRFTLKSSRAPHATIGADAPKALRQELERRLRRTQEICYQPRLLSPDMEQTVRASFGTEPCHFLYRMKAVDSLSRLDAAVRRYSENIKRTASHNLRSYLLELRQIGPLIGAKLNLIEKFLNAYDHARHDPSLFTEEHYEEYTGFLDELVQHVDKRSREKNPSQIVRESSTTAIDAVQSHTEEITNGDASNLPPASHSGANGNNGSEVTYRPRKRREGRTSSPVDVELLPLTQSAMDQSSSRESSAESEGSSQRGSDVYQGIKLTQTTKGESVI